MIKKIRNTFEDPKIFKNVAFVFINFIWKKNKKMKLE
jgi:hypothetical protein